MQQYERIIWKSPRYQATLQKFETRHANAGCLLTVLFLAPFFARTYSIFLITVATLVYVLLIVPLITGYINVSTVISFIKRFVIRSFLNKDSHARVVFRSAISFLLCCHQRFLCLQSVHTTANQLLFNFTLEKLICPQERFSCLYVLLFYSVLAYLQSSLQKRHWTQMLHDSSAADFMRLTTSWLIVKMGKTIVLSMVMLTLTLQFNDIDPPAAYVAVTAAYFLLTQYPELGAETRLVCFVKTFDIYLLEGLEEYWIPSLSRLISIFSSIVVVTMAWLNCNYVSAILLSYINIYLSWLHFVEKCWAPLQSQRLSTSAFPYPSYAQFQERKDHTCAVCLDDMRPLTAKVTPCKHMFHTVCLRKCLQQFGQCPLCKQNLR